MDSESKLALAIDRTSQWGLRPLPAVVVEHWDRGFTGGVVGFPHFESLIVSRSWVDQLSPEQLSVAIARRLEAAKESSRRFRRPKYCSFRFQRRPSMWVNRYHVDADAKIFPNRSASRARTAVGTWRYSSDVAISRMTAISIGVIWCTDFFGQDDRSTSPQRCSCFHS